MPLLDDLNPIGRVYTCRVRDVRSGLDEADQKTLDDALANKSWSSHGLARALQAKGVDLRVEAIRRHRDGVCSCSRI